MADDIENAAALDAGRKFFVLEADGNRDVDAGVLVNAHQIDVDRDVANGIDLHFAGDDGLKIILARNIDLGEVRAHPAGGVRLKHFDLLEADRNGALVAAVKNAGDPALAPGAARPARAGPLADFAVENVCLGHGGTLMQKAARRAPWPRRGAAGS